MSVLHGAASDVPLARIAREHRMWLLPLGIAMVANIGIFGAGVLPLSSAVAAAEQRAATAARSLAAAEQEYSRAEATREAQTLATRDLQIFYRDVLPTSFAEARRITHVRLTQMAEANGVRYERMTASPEVGRESALERLSVTMGLAGDYEDIRAFLYTLETSEDFIVIENISLEEASGNGAPLALTLTLSTYYLAGEHGP